MRLAPFVPLPPNSLRLRLAYLADFFESTPSPKPKIMSCWQLGYRITLNLIVAACIVVVTPVAAIGSLFILCVVVYNNQGAQWSFGILFGTFAVCGLWSHFRMTKRLHVLKRRLCPLLVLST